MPRFPRIFCIISFCLALPPALVSAEPLSLAHAVAMWRVANIDLKLAKHTINAAAADVSTADRRENPNLSLSSTSLSSRAGLGSGGLRSKNADSVLRLEQLIERGGKREYRTQSAEARLKAARLDAEDGERTGLIQLHQAYWDLKLAFERERLTEATAQLSRDAALAAEKRLKVGDIGAADVSKLRVDTLRGENDARAAFGERQKSQLALAVLIGRSGDAETLSCTDDWPDIGEFSANAVTTSVQWESRADVLAATARITAAEAALEGARSLGKRDVTVGVQFEHYPTAGDAPPNNTWGFSIGVPIFASHAYEGESLRAAAELEQSRDQAERTQAMARAEVRRFANDYRASGERLQRLEMSLLPEAGKVATAAEFAYLKGATSLLELLDARRTLRQIQQDAATAKSDFAKALAAIRLQSFPYGNKSTQIGQQ